MTTSKDEITEVSFDEVEVPALVLAMMLVAVSHSVFSMSHHNEKGQLVLNAYRFAKIIRFIAAIIARSDGAVSIPKMVLDDIREVMRKCEENPEDNQALIAIASSYLLQD